MEGSCSLRSNADIDGAGQEGIEFAHSSGLVDRPRTEPTTSSSDQPFALWLSIVQGEASDFVRCIDETGMDAHDLTQAAWTAD